MRTIIPQNAKLISERAEKVFQGKIFDVYQWQQELFDGSHATFEMLRRPDTVNVLAVKDGKLVLIKQQQPGSAEFYGIPGGRHDNPRETELEAAKREMLEETGMTFKNWRLIWATQPFGKMEWFVYLFLATDFESQTVQKLDAGEKISVELMALDEVINLINGLDSSSRLDFTHDIFDHVKNMDDLTNWPEYRGEKVG